MKIILAKHSGFCMGVRNAVLKIIKEINESGGKISMYGPLIHNPQTIDILSKRGLITIKDIKDIKNSRVAIRTHGVTIDEHREIKKNASSVINLTCPRVGRVQGIIKKYSNQGYFTLITGDKNHAEVVGLISFAGSGVFVISEESDIEKIPFSEKYVLVSQTTFDRDFFYKTSEALNNKMKNIEVIDTICDSTRLRQEEVLDAVKNGVDALVVVGGKNSANTSRLATIGREKGLSTFHVETEKELSDDDFKNIKKVLITAGASTPGWIINNVLERIYNIKFKNSNFFINALEKFWEFAVRANLLSSAAAFFFSVMAQKSASSAFDIRYSIISSLYIFSMYSINNYFDREFLKASNSYKYGIYDRFGFFLTTLSLIAMGISLYLGFSISILSGIFLLSVFLFGFTYSTKAVKNIFSKFKTTFFKKFYYSKLITSFGWVFIISIFPLIYNEMLIIGIVGFGLYLFGFIFLRHALIDMIAYQGDLILGRDTLPIWIGVKSFLTISMAVGASVILLFGGASVYLKNYSLLPLIINILYYMIILNKIKKADYLITLKYELIVDFNFFILIGCYIFYTYTSLI
jgi:4-hydroxy-3-methylbut-2-enyl diphosphate reductase